jgi:hypothetical protein
VEIFVSFSFLGNVSVGESYEGSIIVSAAALQVGCIPSLQLELGRSQEFQLQRVDDVTRLAAPIR